MPRFPQKKSRAKRIKTASFKGKIFGFNPKQIMENFIDFKKRITSNRFVPLIVRIYKLPSNPPRHILHSVQKNGAQWLYEIIPRGKNIQFVFRGNFYSDFMGREIKDPTLRGYGLGTAALKAHIALARRGLIKSRQFPDASTSKKSTALLFLRNGYGIDNRLAGFPLTLNKKVITNAQQLRRFLLDPSTPENLPFDIPLLYGIKERRKKAVA